MPMKALAAINWSGLLEKADAAEPTAKMASPPIKTHLRPRWSPREPEIRSSPAKTIV